MKHISRRSFLKSTALAASAFGLPVHSWSQIRGANDDIRVAIVGFNGQGSGDMEGFRKVPGVRVVALCDVDRNVLAGGEKKFKERNEPIQTYTDVRKLLENKDIDVVHTATPNHWHALIAIWAVQAGKDVYVQKPVSHNVFEGRQIVNAARKYNRMVQTGTQSRSSQAIREAVEWVQAGNLGKIQIARGTCYKRRASIGKVSGPQPIPEGVDYDLWCGPAPITPLMRKKLHYDWHWVWATGCGDLGNQGIHQMDIARWFLGEKELSPRVFSLGGRFGYIDDGETPNTQIIYHDYAKAPLIFEVRGLPMNPTAGNKMDSFMGASIGVVIHCENGYVLVPDYTQATAFDKEGNKVKQWKGNTSHYANLIEAVRSRKSTDLHADILEGHLSSALCHTGNISYRLGKKVGPDKARQEIKGNKDAVETFNRMAEHLKNNEVNLDSTKLTMGAFLKMDGKAEKFTNNRNANQMLTRDYRKPFVVPEKV
ncbi:MAG TPA: Gfo/Idh/MocA family oxidoreductase [Candidatus Saccharimonadales bacterium]|nr:Gfo/Idh/MocA family oxidoreductase [Candidatus Saccharimonadales bacterium]